MKLQKFVLGGRAGVILALVVHCGVRTAWSDQVWGDFRYVENVEPSNTVTIARYIGAGGDVAVPAEIEGLPVVAVGENAFRFIWDLTGMTLPNNVTSIGPGAFSWCENLTNVFLGPGVVEIGARAFQHCHSLSAIELPDSVERIGWMAFYDCF